VPPGRLRASQLDSYVYIERSGRHRHIVSGIIALRKKLRSDRYLWAPCCMICILYVAPALAGETGKVGNKGKPTTDVDGAWWILKDKLRIRTHGIVEH
jgi:hypothetical protein